MENKKKIIIAICAVIGVIVVAVCGFMICYKDTIKPVTSNNGDDKKVVKKVDDWKYDDEANDDEIDEDEHLDNDEADKDETPVIMPKRRWLKVLIVLLIIAGLAVGALTGIILNAILPGKDYEFGSNEQGDTSVNFGSRSN